MSDETTNITDTAGSIVEPSSGADFSGGIADDQETTEQDAQPKPADTQENGGEQQDGASPEPYELTVPDGFDVPADNLKGFEKVCNEIGLTKDQADKLLGWHKEQADLMAADSQQQTEQVMQAWAQEMKADPEFGGKNWSNTVASARRAFEMFDPDGSLREFLRESRYQHNPMVIRAVARVGRAMSEHDWVSGDGKGVSRRQARLEDRLWPDM
jgi:hypothetical protein